MAGELFSVPKQRRSRDSLDRVLGAARELLEEGGYDAMRIAEVSERANVGTASIYARVGSKHGLLLAVQAQMVQELDQEGADALGPLRAFGGPFPELVSSAVAGVAAQFRTHERLLRVFMIRAGIDDAVVSHGSASSQVVGDLFAEVLLQRRDEIAHGDPERAVDVCFRMVYDTLARWILRGSSFESRHDLGWDELVAELGVACSAYLMHARYVGGR